MNSQEATEILGRWQSYRGDTALTPEQKIELALFDFLLPPVSIMSEAEYDAQLRTLGEALQEAA